MRTGDKVVCIWPGPWYGPEFVISKRIITPELNKVYTVRDCLFYPWENAWGILLVEIVNPPIPIKVGGGKVEMMEMPFSPSYFRPAVGVDDLDNVISRDPEHVH